jgi:lycopene beta-cyclase
MLAAMRYDAVIAGGGLSGLSLAAHLARSGWHNRSVLVVDDGRRPAASWAYWSATEDGLGAAVSRTFRQVRVNAAGRSMEVPLGPYRYEVVRRSDLRAVVTRILSACPGFSIVSGHVDDVRDAGDSAEVVVDGRVVEAAWAFDSVTHDDSSTVDAMLAFTGHEIRTEQPVFDSETPVLMDFRTAPGVGARFAYVLPSDAHRALVELTEFVPRHATVPAEHERREALAAYVRDVLGAQDHEVLRVESAVLPLRAQPGPRQHGRVLRIGAAGGLIKASTGYAYERIQRDSRAVTASLVRNGHPFELPPSRPRHRLMDALLFDVFDRDPAQLERAFALLFRRLRADSVLRFLDEDASLVADLRLMAALPPGPYLRALAGRLSGH